MMGRVLGVHQSRYLRRKLGELGPRHRWGNPHADTVPPELLADLPPGGELVPIAELDPLLNLSPELNTAAPSITDQVMRLREDGWTQQRIADHLGVTRSKVRRIIDNQKGDA